jgi:hypothetical protein
LGPCDLFVCKQAQNRKHILLATYFTQFFLLVQIFSKMSGHDHEELIDYEDEHDIPNLGATSGGAGDADGKDKKNFSGIHSTGFR